MIAPMVIFKGECFNPELTVGKIPDTLYGVSSLGWIDKRAFLFLVK